MVDCGRMRRILLAIFAFVLSENAFAQISAQASIASDYVFRGVSLTDGRPTAAVEIDYDSPTGWFAGALATETHLYGETRYEPEYVVDVGYAHALGAGLTWEAGATYSIFSDFSIWNYAEVFAGVLGERWNARLYCASDYFGRGRRTYYAEFNYAQPLAAHWRLLGHVGLLQGSKVSFDPHARTLDASIGVAAKFGNTSFAVKRSLTNHDNYLYPLATASDRGAWTVSLAYSY